LGPRLDHELSQQTAQSILAVRTDAGLIDHLSPLLDLAIESALQERCISGCGLDARHGGIAQGVGQALWEQCFTDPASGQPVCGSLMDYGMPRSNNLPSFTTEIVEVRSPSNPLGIKAGGEGGTTPALAVVISAIADALHEFAIEEIVMPATPLAVWQAFQRGRARKNEPAAVHYAAP
jgi:hypothetical protein